MEIKTLTSDISVSDQITPEDITALKAAGFRTIICNRPDGEGPNQPTFDDITKAAQNVGIKTLYLPVITGMLADADVIEFGRALAALPAPVLAYCRSGARSATLWALEQAKTHPRADILTTAKAAGYDLTGVVR